MVLAIAKNYPANIYLFKVSNRTSFKMCLTIDFVQLNFSWVLVLVKSLHYKSDHKVLRFCADELVTIGDCTSGKLSKQQFGHKVSAI